MALSNFVRGLLIICVVGFSFFGFRYSQLISKFSTRPQVIALQPTTYSRPITYKGTTRFVTEEEAAVWNQNKSFMFGSLALGVLLFVVLNVLHPRQDWNRGRSR